MRGHISQVKVPCLENSESTAVVTLLPYHFDITFPTLEKQTGGLESPVISNAPINKNCSWHRCIAMAFTCAAKCILACIAVRIKFNSRIILY